MSLGGGASTTLQNAVRYARRRTTSLIVAAAGNDGNATLNYPAAYAEVVSVAATDASDVRASFSNANSDVEIAAPGVNVLSTYNDGGYRVAVGHVDGHAARLGRRRDHPRRATRRSRAAQARSKLDASVDDKGPAGRDTSVRLRPGEPGQGRHLGPPESGDHRRNSAAGAGRRRYSRRPRLYSTAASRRPSPRSGRSVAVTWRQ